MAAAQQRRHAGSQQYPNVQLRLLLRTRTRIHVLTSYDQMLGSCFYHSLKNIAWSLQIFCERPDIESTDEGKQQFVTQQYKNGLRQRYMAL